MKERKSVAENHAPQEGSVSVTETRTHRQDLKSLCVVVGSFSHQTHVMPAEQERLTNQLRGRCPCVQRSDPGMLIECQELVD